MNSFEMPAHEPPLPTDDVNQALGDFSDAGVCIIPNVISDEKLGKLRAATLAAADDDREYGRETILPGDDKHVRRVWGLVNRSPRFAELVEHPLALTFVRASLGWPVLLSNFIANILEPGNERMFMHADQAFSPPPWRKADLLNICWCIDDFTADNGATMVGPGTHLLGRQVGPDDREYPLVSLIAPAGSMIAIDGRIWHSSGSNRSQEPRAALFATYIVPELSCTENWALSLNPLERQYASETLLQLLGFRPTAKNLRMMINGNLKIEGAGATRTK